VAETNFLPTQRRLRPGTELVIPVAPGKPKSTRTASAAPVAGATASSAATTASPVRKAAAHAPRDRARVQYKIAPGDTLASIAAEHGTTVAKLRTWNGIKGSRIAAGDTLTIYTDPAHQ
jgi:LysM repeat protein